MWPHGVVTNVILSKGIQPKTYVLCKSFCAISCNVPSQAIFICGVRSWDGVTIAGGGGPLGEMMGRRQEKELVRLSYYFIWVLASWVCAL